MDKQTIVFVGISGAGKGTQAQLLEEYLKKTGDLPIHHIETGKLFRQFLEHNTYAGKLSRDINASGGLQPDFLATWLWGNALIASVTEEGEHLIIDGTPRRVSEAHMLLSAFNFLKRERVTVIYLNVSEKEALVRLEKRKRKDDMHLDGVMNRFSWFAKEVIPTIDFFKKDGSVRVLDVNGEGSVEDIHQEIITLLND